MKRLLAILFICASAWGATTYHVKKTGNDTTGDGSAGNPWLTIGKCKTTMAAGDTCLIYNGDYSAEGALTLTAGTAGNYKTLQVNSGDTVTTKEWTLNSHTKLIGFTISDTASPSSARCVLIGNSVTDVYVTSNTISECGSGGAIVGGTSPASTYVFIQSNTISYACTPIGPPTVQPCIGISLGGDHWLIENNDISHVSDFVAGGGNHHVIRNNTFHDAYESECVSLGCHIDGVQSEPRYSSLLYETGVILMENNTITNNVGTNSHGGGLFNGDGPCSDDAAHPLNKHCMYAIFRFNVMAHAGAGLGAGYGWDYVKRYNNTYADAVALKWPAPFAVDNSSGNSTYGGALYGSAINQLYWFPGSDVLTDGRVYGTDTTIITGQPATPNANSTFTARNNLANCAGGVGACNIKARVSSSFTSADTGNIDADPLFTSYSSSALGTLTLTSSSPAINAGSYLTTVAATDTGTGTDLIVDDCAYFQDGDTTLGVLADGIRIGASTNAQIAVDGITYSTCHITLTGSVSRSAGDPVYLRLDSSGNQVLYTANPDIGGYAYAGPWFSRTPATIAFGDQTSGTSSASQSATITCLDGPCTLSTSALTTGTQFTITSDTCDDGAVSTNATCIVAVKFNPTADGAKTDTLTIASTAPGVTSLTVALSGTGITVPTAPSATLTASASVLRLGQTFTLTWGSDTNADIGGEIDHSIGSVCSDATTCNAGGTTAAITCTAVGSTTYTFVATGSGGTAQAQVTVRCDQRVVSIPVF